VKLFRLSGQKIPCSPSFVDYRPKTNAAILLDMGHTKEKPYTGGIGQGKEKIKNLNVGVVLPM
jgi:hypothetical protein